MGEPLAMAYAGHQFGAFVPQLGDGRAILLGEVVDADGVRRDIQLKGSGPTPFSRNGDGRAALGPVLREYIVSEAMAALGIPTTRSLAVVTTGETVRREMPLPGAVLTRVASSHIRVGTFQYFAVRADVDAIRHLADHVIARHYPEATGAANPYQALLEHVIARQADLIAQWLLVGFIHGVMNTDNMSIAGETIDYGPCAFMDSYDPATVYSSIDSFGRYAYGNQPRIAQWNLARLAEALLPLLDDDKDTAIQKANEALDGFGARFETAYTEGLRRKLGLLQAQPEDLSLAQGLLERMAQNGADFTLTFRRLCEAAASPDADAGVRSLFTDPTAYDGWAEQWRRRLAERRHCHRARAHVGDARGQSGRHPPQSSRRGSDLGCRKQQRFRAVRESDRGARQTLRRPASDLRPVRRSAPARSGRAPDVLRHLEDRLAAGLRRASGSAGQTRNEAIDLNLSNVLARVAVPHLPRPAEKRHAPTMRLAKAEIGSTRKLRSNACGRRTFVVIAANARPVERSLAHRAWRRRGIHVAI